MKINNAQIVMLTVLLAILAVAILIAAENQICPIIPIMGNEKVSLQEGDQVVINEATLTWRMGALVGYPYYIPLGEVGKVVEYEEMTVTRCSETVFLFEYH